MPQVKATHRQSFEDAQERNLCEWSARIDLLRARAHLLRREAQLELSDTLETLLRQRETVRAQMSALRHSSDQAWADAKYSLETARKELKSAYFAAATYFE